MPRRPILKSVETTLSTGQLIRVEAYVHRDKDERWLSDVELQWPNGTDLDTAIVNNMSNEDWDHVYDELLMKGDIQC